MPKISDMSIYTVLWTVGAIVIGYATCMELHPGTYFEWACVVSAIVSTGMYHVGKAQDKGGMVDAAMKAMSLRPENK